MTNKKQFIANGSATVKYLLALLTSCCLPALLFCQGLTITKGELISDDAYSAKVEALCKYKDGSIGVIKKSFKKKRSENPDYFIEQFDSNLKRISSNLIKTPNLTGAKPHLFSLHAVGDHFCVFWYSRVEKATTASIYYSVLTNDGTATEIKKVSEMKDSKSLIQSWGTYLADKGQTWVVEKTFKDEKTAVANFVFECYDANLNQKFTREFNPYKENVTIGLSNLVLDNSGYMAMAVSDWGKKRKAETSINQHLFLCNDKGVSKALPLNPPTGYAIRNAAINFTENDIEVLGTYANINQKKKLLNPPDYGAVGTFSIRIDKKDIKIVQQEFTPFPNDIFDYYLINIKDREDGLIGLDISDLIVKDPLSSYLVLDKTNGSDYVSGNKIHNSIYSGSGVVVAYQNGKPQRRVILPKAMHSDDEYAGLGFLVQKTGASVQFLYNDAPKNRNLDLKSDMKDAGESPMSTTNALVKKKADVMCITMTEDSAPKKSFLLGYKEDGVFLNHLNSLPIDEGSFIFITGIDGKYQLNKLTYGK
jgi:hypothetical protein